MEAKKNTHRILFITEGEREPVVELKNGRCNVKTLHLTMSRRTKAVLLLDLLLLVLIPILIVSDVPYQTTTSAVVGIYAIAMLMCGVFFLNTISDFRTWLFTMNRMNEQMGEWILEDFSAIVKDLVNAGCRLAAEEVEKAKKVETAIGDGEAQSQ